MKYHFYGKIIKDKFEINNKDWFKDVITAIRGKRDEIDCELTIKEYKKNRTSGKAYQKSNQNGYYWGVVIPLLSSELGYLPDEIHTALKYKFLRVGGSSDLPKIKSTSTLNTQEWEELMDKIRTWSSSELNIIIPEPYEKI